MQGLVNVTGGKGGGERVEAYRHSRPTLRYSGDTLYPRAAVKPSGNSQTPLTPTWRVLRRGGWLF